MKELKDHPELFASLFLGMIGTLFWVNSMPEVSVMFYVVALLVTILPEDPPGPDADHV